MRAKPFAIRDLCFCTNTCIACSTGDLDPVSASEIALPDQIEKKWFPKFQTYASTMPGSARLVRHIL